jgi:hypothetical protein
MERVTVGKRYRFEPACILDAVDGPKPGTKVVAIELPGARRKDMASTGFVHIRALHPDGTESGNIHMVKRSSLQPFRKG